MGKRWNPQLFFSAAKLPCVYSNATKASDKLNDGTRRQIHADILFTWIATIRFFVVCLDSLNGAVDCVLSMRFPATVWLRITKDSGSILCVMHWQRREE